MRFKKLELLGFKSFADQTELIFEPGVTAIVGPNGCGKCLAPSERVLTADGRRLEIGPLVESSLRKSRQVISLDDGFTSAENPDNISILSLNPETLRLEPRPVAAFIKRTAPDHLLRIQTKSGRAVTATPYHPLFTLRGGALHALRADEVRPGVRIAVPRNLPLPESDGRVWTTGEILSRFRTEDGIYVPYSGRLRAFITSLAKQAGGVRQLTESTGLPVEALRGVWSKQAINAAHLARLCRKTGVEWEAPGPFVSLKSRGSGEIRLPKRVSKDLSRFLGYLISEGRTTRSNQVWFVNEDPAMIRDYCRVARRVFGVRPRVFSYKPKTKDVLIFSRALCVALERLYGLSVEGGSASKGIPDSILAAPKPLAAQFISTLFEGDGYLSARGTMRYIEYATASETLADDLMTLLLRFGVTALKRPKVKYASNTVSRNRRLYHSVYVYGAENLKVLAEVLQFAGRKREKLDRFRRAEPRPNPNLDLIPGLQGTIREWTRTAGLRIKALRSESPRLASYWEGRAEASRVGVLEVAALVRRHGTPVVQTEAITTRLERLAQSDLLWDEIVAVEEVAPRHPWVYDLSIAETHNFVAENIVVHNSNIADAIKWVLGEQSAKELRGGRMEDLIFNGSDRREPINYAEVSLTLDNSDKQLPIEFTEVTISRRVFRSGESVYTLNRAPVRLKDIHQLLMGTGVGSSAYSLFEQGRIDQVISARPEDRRAIFEEAAGITKYKGQKREAMRRLDETEQNLARVSDIVAEVKRQIQGIERQVRRARAYQEQMEELKHKEVSIAAHKTGTLAGRWAAQAEAIKRLTGEQGQIEGRLNSQEERLQERRERVQRMDEGLHAAREQLMQVRNRQESSAAALKLHRDRQASAAARQQRIEEELSRCELQLGEVDRRRTELTAQVEQESALRREAEETIASLKGALESCAVGIQEAQREIAATQGRILEETALQVQFKNELSKVRQEAARVEARESRLSAEERKVAAEREEARGQIEAKEQVIAQMEVEVRHIQEQLTGCEDRLENSESRLAEIQEEVSQMEQEETRVSSQLELLKGLLTSHEGYSSGVKALLTGMDQGKVSREGVLGALAELIQIAPPEAAAVDAALGIWSEAVVVETSAAAERCRDFLKESQAGRVLFLILERLPSEDGQAVHLASCPISLEGGQGRPPVDLRERVGITPHLEPLLRFLLADTWLVTDRSEAIERVLRMDGEAGSRFVTADGELFQRESVRLGSKPAEEGLVVGRMSRLQSLEVAHAHVQRRLQETLGNLERVQNDHDAAREETGKLRNRFQDKNQELKILHSGLWSSRDGLKKLEEEISVLELERGEVREELAGVRSQMETAERNLNEKNQTVEQLEGSVQTARTRIGELTARREADSVALAGAEAQQKAFDEMAANRRASLQTLEAALSHTGSQLTARRGELNELCEEQARCAEQIRELEAMAEGTVQSEREAAEAVARAEREKQQAAEAAREQEREWQTLSQETERVRSALHREEMKRAQLSFEKEQIDARLRERYEVTLETYAEPVLPIADEAALAEMTREVEALDQKLKRMGPVNLASIDEEKELTQRYEHLTTQQADLEKAKSDLHGVILKINRTTRTMFRETFEAIQREFRSTFKQLFRGGEARLVLTDEEDVLESGIEIIARPPGKTLQSISLMSGGEKAMTSIALLFAIFRVKPSPFCLLDEIDAPLDEANVDRFTGALKEFLQQSQFIIVTHNKKTISMSDVMYGITMAESGVSRIVSVKFKQQEKQAA